MQTETNWQGSLGKCNLQGQPCWDLEQSRGNRYEISDQISSDGPGHQQWASILPWRGYFSAHERLPSASVSPDIHIYCSFNSSFPMNRSPTPAPDPLVLPTLNLCLHLDRCHVSSSLSIEVDLDPDQLWTPCASAKAVDFEPISGLVTFVQSHGSVCTSQFQLFFPKINGAINRGSSILKS